ncbi:MAG: DEAD/DEAH box helicase family protein [Oscillospiraceae bacterium]|jgi:type III restriction enzyme|nr:DEAD/DEAH box helicase family protein [Oscillospiraceae bacterium]
MKLKFKHQSFQTDAVNAVTDLFAGQEKNQATFSLAQTSQIMLTNDFGIGNALLLPDDALLANMRTVQKRNRLPQTADLAERQFCVEMETGTGKTYVYTKTIFELHRQYGFTKFIIVVPSVAIREGVYKSFQVTAEHFGTQYDNVPCRYFIYNSAKLSDVRQFATSANIEIMIINIDAFKKAENIINQAQDKLNGETAMRYIQDTRPIVIIDEPQSVDNTPKAKEAVASLNPMCVLRYSATHKEKINLLYRLTPVDAYEKGLVKQICVSSNRAENDFNKPYIRLLEASNKSGFTAKIEIDVAGKDGKVTRKTFTVRDGADLFTLSGNRDLYEGYRLNGIDCSLGGEYIEFVNTESVRLGQAIGALDENLIKRAQIRRTIEAHLNKELLYYGKGIKVLSLFFIDEVAKYRLDNSQCIIHNSQLDDERGVYARMFEECYMELIMQPKFKSVRKFWHGDNYELCIMNSELTKVHDGYFSQDKKGILRDTRGDTAADYDTYNTIMKDKEWLLSFDCPLRFIFSHSALKEGWDNPNVFQVCTLIEQKSAFTCRQKVGRGLRLCVDQDGNRIEDKNINVLHVMANESFAEFAETLQREIEEETGVRFGEVNIQLFMDTVYEETRTVEQTVTAEQAAAVVDMLKANGVIDDGGNVSSSFSDEEIEKLLDEQATVIPVAAKTAVSAVISKAFDTSSDESDSIVNPVTIDVAAIAGASYAEIVVEEKTISYEEAAEIVQGLTAQKLVTRNNKMSETLKAQVAAGRVDLDSHYSEAKQRAILQQLQRADTKPPVRDASRDVTVRLKKQVILSPKFLALWDKIKQKTTYRVKIDTETLIRQAVKRIAELPPMPPARIVSTVTDLDIQSFGVTGIERGVRTEDIANNYAILPDIINVIGEVTRTKRGTVYEIIQRSGRIGDFISNPQMFIEQITEIIKNERHALAIDGIRYIRLDGQEYFAQEIFDTQEFLANLDRNAVAVKNSVYDYIVYDSGGIEKPFAKALDDDPDVKMFIKLPPRFKIDTPIGSYNPDWAVYLDRDGEEKLYFILETKGSTNLFDLRTSEQLKIHCGKRHFAALENGVEMRVETQWSQAKSMM